MSKVVVHRGRTTIVGVELGFDITGDTITSEIRTEPDQEATLICAWEVDVIDPLIGELELTIDDAISGAVEVSSGYMDLKRVSGGEPLSVFDKPLEVVFRGTVTA